MAKSSSLSPETIKIGVLVAEFVGTFSLAYAVLASINGSLAPTVPTAVIAGFTLVLAVLSIGGISGAHINPSVTLGLLSINKISLRKAIFYLLAQFAGALAALGLMSLVLHGNLLSVKSDISTWKVFFGEMVGAIIFTFGVASAVEQGLQKISAAILVGGSLLLGLIFASIASNGVLNPAVAVAIGSSTWAYILGPIAGAVIGMNLQHYMRKSA
jgi:glycerol uptake facilitator-like aquaporin